MEMSSFEHFQKTRGRIDIEYKSNWIFFMLVGLLDLKIFNLYMTTLVN